MILEIDYGNTRLKWRLLEASSARLVAEGAVSTVQALLPQLRAAGCLSIVYCRACSVRNAEDNKQLSLLLEKHYGVVTQYAQSVKQLAGVTNGYLQAEKLGVDRWLAIIAGYTQLKHACVVIDCGTAITVDYVAADGQHLGGCIAPGLNILARALSSGTQLQLEHELLTAAVGKLGTSTQIAVAAGIQAMLRGFIQEQIDTAKDVLGPVFSVICTGGDSLWVCDAIDNMVIDKDLVFIGLAIACPYGAKE